MVAVGPTPCLRYKSKFTGPAILVLTIVNDLIGLNLKMHLKTPSL